MASTTPRTPLKLRIGELAQRTGRSVHTIRWYEQQGLLPPVPRLGTHRLYSNRHVEWLELMDRLRLSGMPIAELRRYTALAQRGACQPGGDPRRAAGPPRKGGRADRAVEAGAQTGGRKDRVLYAVDGGGGAAGEGVRGSALPLGSWIRLLK
jgi:DNA-binding transcriptional MerR regulator